MSIQCHACIGGTNVGEDIRKLDYGQHVVSGTPGRVFGKLFINHFYLNSRAPVHKVCKWSTIGKKFGEPIKQRKIGYDINAVSPDWYHMTISQTQS